MIMRKYSLILSMFLLIGAGASLHSLAKNSVSNGVCPIPPTLEEIHLDLLGSSYPPKPRSEVVFPLYAWYNVDDRSVIIEPAIQTGWLTIIIEDEMEKVFINELVNGDLGRSVIGLSSLSNNSYKLTIQGGVSDSFVLSGWFEVH